MGSNPDVMRDVLREVSYPVPVVEIPNAEYLDCDAGAFFEALIRYQPNEMIICLQEFDRGVFGGASTRTNAQRTASSSGMSWLFPMGTAGFAVGATPAPGSLGWVFMVVDSTELLNTRHIDVVAKGDALLTPYPPVDEVLPFDAVRLHTSLDSGGSLAGWISQPEHPSTRAVTADDIVVIDTPCICAKVPGDSLKASDQRCDALLFADVCKEVRGLWRTPSQPCSGMECG